MALDTAVTTRFFTNLCETHPTVAHMLMMNILSAPTGGVSIVLPCLVQEKDIGPFYREQQRMAADYIFSKGPRS
jgi:hypothetical protein